MIKVLIVDDSAFMRQILKKTIEKQDDLEVLDTAANGIKALSTIEENKPDVIILDIEMPVKNGLETLKEIMNLSNPIPTIMVSAVNNRETVMKALEIGAFDFIPKPQGSSYITSLDQINKNLISKIRAAAKMEGNPNTKIKPLTPYKENISKSKAKSKFPLVIIGTSSGGPKALKAMLPVFPADFPAAITIVQHMPAGFTASLAKRLNHDSCIAVKEAAHHDSLQPGLALLAPGDYHMEINNERKVILNQDPHKWSVRPSVDYLLSSAAKNYNDKIIGVILTGMGCDGSEGMKAIKSEGGYGIVEDKSTALVYGMPGCTIKAGAYDEILPLHQIPFKIIELVERGF
ncbi:MAG: protein-glutamate methylesterase/protein-glutamine glutaminase [Halanaerobiaceae bacterium]